MMQVLGERYMQFLKIVSERASRPEQATLVREVMHVLEKRV